MAMNPLQSTSAKEARPGRRLPIGELHLKISPAVEPLGKLPSTPGDSCDKWEIGPLAERFRFFPEVAGPGEHVASDFRPRRDDALVA
jgi:hypothetical protein